MKYRKHIGIITMAAMSAAGLFSCTADLLQEPDGSTQRVEGVNVPTKLRLYVTAEERQEGMATRFTTEANDGWSIGGSVNYFSTGDTVGIFARYGNFNLPTSNGKGGPLINIPMMFEAQENVLKDPSKPWNATTNPYETKYILVNDTVEVLPSVMSSAEVFMYYPYTKDMGDLRNYPGWKEYANTPNFRTGSIYFGDGYKSSTAGIYADKTYPNIIGLPIRIKAGDGSIRCRDVAEMYTASQADLNKGIISGTVRHGFSSMQILRDDGFKEPKRKDPVTGQLVDDWSIIVVLNIPVTHMRVVCYNDGGVRWTTQLYHDPSYTIDGHAFTDEEARQWEAWEGLPYKANNTAEEERAWYVLLPSIYWQNDADSWNGHSDSYYSHAYCVRPTVSEIMIYDDEGYLQHVTNFNLKTSDGNAATKKTYPYFRFRVKIAMDEFGTTVRPVAIVDWDEEGDDKDLTEERSAGIHDVNDYINWVSTYNTYITNGRRGSAAEELAKYGDFVDDTYWNFYISEFIVPSNVDLPQVTDMQDRLVGNNNFFNVTFENLKFPGPMFKTVSYYGGIQNIDFRNVRVSTGWNAGPIGMIAGEIVSDFDNDNVLFQNCNLYNCIVENQGPVGLFAGSMSFGKIVDCEMSGFVLGTSTSQTLFPKVFAIPPSNTPIWNNFNYNNINSATL